MGSSTTPGFKAMLIRVVIKLGGWQPSPVPDLKRRTNEISTFVSLSASVKQSYSEVDEPFISISSRRIALLRLYLLFSVSELQSAIISQPPGAVSQA